MQKNIVSSKISKQSCLTILHFMDMRIFFFILFFFLSETLAEAEGPNCKPIQCSNGGPRVSFPFYFDGQPRDCGSPGFELTCSSNTTMIKLPFQRDLAVKSISYDDKRLDLVDPASCVHEVFLNLDLSETPLNYYHSLKSYTYINCSIEPGSPSGPEIPCLSGHGHRVYTVPSSSFSVAENRNLSSSCRVVKVVEIPFGYSPYLSDNSFGLELTWESVDSCEGCNGRGNRAVSAAVLVFLVVAALVWMKIANSKDRYNCNEPMDEQFLRASKNLIVGDEHPRKNATGSI